MNKFKLLAAKHRYFLMGGLVVISGSGLLLDLPAPWPQFLAIMLIFVWPTITWAAWWGGELEENFVFGAGWSLFLNMMGIMLITYLPGPVLRPLQLGFHVFVALLPLFRPKQGVANPVKSIIRPIYWTLPVLLFAAYFRFYNLGYSEFQGDEGVVMVRAAAIFTGDETEIFLHQKGPAEILLPLGAWGLSRTINEFWARWPFAWSSLFAVWVMILLTRRWFGRPVGLIAGLLLGILGFSVAFGRIVQYQSLVILWSLLAVYFTDRFRVESQRRYLLLASLFFAGGLIAHYDAVIFAPTIGWLLWQRKRSRPFDWLALGTAALLGFFVIGAFYLPFLLNSNFSRTSQYLVNARLGVGGGSGLMTWSGPAIWRMITFYNSIYYFAALFVCLLIGLQVLWRRRTGLAAVLMLLVPLLFYALFVADPRTHVYTFFPGAILLASVGTGHIWRELKASRFRGAFILGFAIIFSLSTFYVYLMFIDNVPERQRTWVENRPKGFPAAWREPPLYGLFGFPHQAGWRVVYDLLSDNAYPYASNEEKEVSNWYLNQAPRTHCPNFETFILTEDTQDEIPYDRAWLDDLYLQHQVMVNGRPALKIYGRNPVSNIGVHEAANQNHWLTMEQAAPSLYSGKYQVNLTLGDDKVKLMGFDIEQDSVSPGEPIDLTLYWQALQPIDRNYQTFVHLYGSELLAQNDSAPDCAHNPTTRWEPGQIIADPHIVDVPLDVSPQSVSLFVGIYDLITKERLTVEALSSDLIFLKEIKISIE